VVWFLPGEKHWHGATPTTAMTHIAIQEKLDGKVVDWMEQVSDEQYPLLIPFVVFVKPESLPRFEDNPALDCRSTRMIGHEHIPHTRRSSEILHL